MAEINRVRVSWTGFNGQPGVSTHFFSGTDYTFLTALNAFYESMKQIVPLGVTLTVAGSGDILDDATGGLTGQWSHGTDTQHLGAGNGNYMVAEGVLVRWKTSQIHNRRRLQGRTFFVPCISSIFSASGWLAEASRAQLQGYVDTLTLATPQEMVVWGRPKAGAGGVTGAVTAGIVETKPCVLRSRRD